MNISDITIADWITAGAAALQASFAGILLWYVKRQARIMTEQKEIMDEQKDISRRQTDIMQKQEGISKDQVEIMEGQMKLTRKVYELTMLPEMQNDYDNLPSEFFPFTRGGYDKYRKIVSDETLPKKLDVLIEQEGFPPGFEPSKVSNLWSFIKAQEEAWKHLRLWRFVKAIYPLKNEQEEYIRAVGNMSERIDITKGYRRHIDFWEKWILMFEDIREYLEPKPIQLVMLTWLQLARIRTQGARISGRPGEKEFFEFAKTQWECSEISPGEIKSL